MTPEERAAVATNTHTNPYLNDSFYLPADLETRIAEQIHAAIAAERERCAQVAWDTKVDLEDFGTGSRADFAVLNMTALQAAIAAAIRGADRD